MKSTRDQVRLKSPFDNERRLRVRLTRANIYFRFALYTRAFVKLAAPLTFKRNNCTNSEPSKLHIPGVEKKKFGIYRICSIFAELRETWKKCCVRPNYSSDFRSSAKPSDRDAINSNNDLRDNLCRKWAVGIISISWEKAKRHERIRNGTPRTSTSGGRRAG